MERGWQIRAPNLPLPNPFNIKLHCMQRDHMRVWLVYHFGEEFMREVMRQPLPILLPIVVYGTV